MGKPVKKVSARGRSAIWTYERRKPDGYKPPCGVWYAVVTNANAERKAQRAIGGAGALEAYLPVFTLVQRVGGRTRKEVAVVERPVFSRYLFVAPKGAAFHSHCLAGVSGVESIVRGPDGRPAAIPHEIIADLMARDARGDFDLRPQAAREGVAKPHSLTETGFEAGEVVRVGSGPLEGLTGKIKGLAGGSKLRILMDIFGRPAPVDIDVTLLEPAA